MEDRALPFYPEQVAARAAFDHEPLRRSRQEVGDDRVDRDPPPGDGDPGLAGRNEDGTQPALPSLEVELARGRHLPDRAIGADGEHDRRVDVEIRSGRGAEIRRRLAQVAQLDAAFARELDEARDVPQADVQAVFEVEPVLDAFAQQGAPIGREMSTLSDDADERTVRFEA